MKLDVEVARYLDAAEYRVLTAIEIGSRNHEIVPFEMIASISRLTGGVSRVQRAMKSLHKHKLVFHDASKYDGYRLTSMGYDYLALKALLNRGSVVGVGTQIGVGKESDIFEGEDADGNPVVLKFHRLGRTSFRAIKTKRDYLDGRKSAGSWMFLSRLAASREYKYMQGLNKAGFPVPTPLDWSRHCVVMSRVWGYPMTQVSVDAIGDMQKVYEKLMELIVKLAEHGVVHGDFNEFNLMIDSEEKITVIDFPQMISTSHPHAVEQFARDIECVKDYFNKRQRLTFDEIDPAELFETIEKKNDLDVQLQCSGFIKPDRTEDVEDDLENLDLEDEEDWVVISDKEVEIVDDLSGEENDSGSESDHETEDRVKPVKSTKSKPLDRRAIREKLKKGVKGNNMCSKAGKSVRRGNKVKRNQIIKDSLK